MTDRKSPYTQPTYYSDEESQGSDGGYNPSAVVANNANANEYNVEPRLSPNTPAYYPTKSILSNSDDGDSSDGAGDEVNHKMKSPADRISYEASPDDEPASKKKRVSSHDEEGDDDAHSARDVGDDKLDLFNEDSDDDVRADEKQDRGFEGFDEDEPGTENMIADIFGESDAEGDGDFEGFAENEVENDEAAPVVIEENAIGDSLRRHQQHKHGEGDEDSDEDHEVQVSYFDQVMQKIKNDRRRRRRLGKDVEFLNDTDEIIRDVIGRMRDAAEQDRTLLSKGRPATKKIGMLKDVDDLLLKADIIPALIDNGILSVIAEWLSPVVDRTLPSISIRECLLKHLKEFRISDTDLLKESGIGKAVMFIYKHPKETAANKQRAYSLITDWSRPIFNLPSDYSSVTKEERKQMDLEHLPRRRVEDVDKKSKEQESESSGPLKPGDEGFIARARVPQPSNKDYVIRPQWKTAASEEGDDDNEDNGPSTSSYRRRRAQPSIMASVSSASRIERQIKALTRSAASKKKQRFIRAAKMSIEGRNMTL